MEVFLVDLLVVEPKKSASFRSTLTDGEQAMAHSGLSLGGGANSEVDGHDGSEGILQLIIILYTQIKGGN